MIKKHILITGGGTGIGCALAKRFAAKGWQVIIVGRRSELLQNVVSQYPDSIRAVTADVGKHEDRQIITSQVQEPLHLLVHNAAVLGPVGPLLDVSLEDWRSHIASNAEGPLSSLLSSCYQSWWKAVESSKFQVVQPTKEKKA